MEKVFFGVEVKEKFHLPESKEQWIEVRKLNASQKALYLNSIGEMSRSNPDGTIVIDTTKAGNWEKKLLELAVCGYKVYVQEGDQQKLVEGNDPNQWASLYDTMDSDITSDLVSFVQKLNPWLLPVREEDKKKEKI